MTSIPRLLAVGAMVACATLPAYAQPAARPAAPIAAPPAAHPTARVFDRDVLTCIEETPDQISATDPQSDTPPVVNVLVLHDGVSLADARASMKRAAEPYEAVGLRFVTTFRKAGFRSDREYRGKPTGQGDRLIDDAKALLRGARPKGIDVVYVLTAKDIYSGDSSDPDYSLAGLADCIGGVRYPDRAFAVGEYDESVTAFGLEIPPDFTAAVFAHEIGHLFGAHHHYATCSRPAAPASGGLDVCTIMIPDIGLAGLEFSVTNGAVVRGHAYEYATP